MSCSRPQCSGAGEARTSNPSVSSQALYQCTALLTTNVIYSLICLCTLIGYIANKAHPDQTVPLGALYCKQGAPRSACSPRSAILQTRCTQIRLPPRSAINCKQGAPRSDCSLRSSLIRVHFVCVQLEMHLNICSRLSPFEHEKSFITSKISGSGHEYGIYALKMPFSR